MTKHERISIIFTDSDMQDMAKVIKLMNDNSSAYTPRVSRHGICRTLIRQGVQELLSQLETHSHISQDANNGSVLTA